MANGYAGKIAFVDLTTGKIETQTLDKDLVRKFIGGQGIGARILFERQKKGADPLGPENMLGFTTGPLTGTKTAIGGRYTAVCKSPLTGSWGDANSGGFFGSELKAAGWDAVFFRGSAPSPRYLMIADDRIELKDASRLWGQDTVGTEVTIQKQASDKKIRVACIGPASEKLSLISGIVNDGGRVAARSGVGAVMGAKRLKAVAVRGTGKIAIAAKEALDRVRKDYLAQLSETEGLYQALVKYGTCATIGTLVASGATPVKNWQLSGEQSFPNLEKIADANAILKKYQSRKYGCANCPIKCGGIFNVKKGKYPVGPTHKPEYETLAAFGPMCMCDDVETIIKLNDLCNRSGLDTISAGSVLAFAMECFEHGIISESDMDGISLSWGNCEAMVAMLEKMIAREGFGDILADGVKVAADKIGGGAEAYAVHVGRQEPGMHNPLFLPGRATGYVCDPTPGRHTATPMSRIDAGAGAVGPYPELKIEQFERYSFTGKGPLSATISSYLQAVSSAGICYFPIYFGNYPFVEFFNAVTGQDSTMSEILTIGSRIQTLRQCFNIREGIKLSDVKLPGRLSGRPPQEKGPVAGITIDVDSLAREYRQAMGWDPQNGKPKDTVLEKLGLTQLINMYG